MRASLLARIALGGIVVACATGENEPGPGGGGDFTSGSGGGSGAAMTGGAGAAQGGSSTQAGSGPQGGSSSASGASGTAGATAGSGLGGAAAGMGGMSGMGGAGGKGGGGGMGGAGGKGGGGGMGGAGGKGGGGGMSGAGGKGGGGGMGGKAGGGGSGGMPAVTCATNPLPARTTWVATASHSSLGNNMESDTLYNPPAHMFDGDLDERWSTGKFQSGDEWLQIDFGRVVTLSRITLEHGPDVTDYPRTYAVRVSNTSQDFTATVRAMGTGTEGEELVIDLPSPATGRYVTIRQGGTSVDKWWSIAELQASCTD